MTDKKVLDLATEEMWDELVSKGNLRTAVEFYAPWCRESNMMMEVMNQMRGEFPGILFCRYNVDKLCYRTVNMKISGIPSILLVIPITMLLKPNEGPVSGPIVIEHIKGFISADMFRDKLKAFMLWEKK